MAITRGQILKELVPGLNAIFGTEYARYENEHAVLLMRKHQIEPLKKKFFSLDSEKLQLNLKDKQ